VTGRPITRRRKARVWTSVLAAVLLSALTLAACSGGSSDRSEAITIGYFTQPDFLDPALGFTIPSNAALSQVYLPLLTYRRVEGPAGTS
jgi:peptide/nickel transport system substrate-binding protein